MVSPELVKDANGRYHEARFEMFRYGDFTYHIPYDDPRWGR